MAESLEAIVVVAGRVQGVFFRASTRDVAIRHGVRGYVRNLPDGRVEALLQGDPAAIEKVIAFMREGPPGAYVAEASVDWRTPSEAWNAFTVRR